MGPDVKHSNGTSISVLFLLYHGKLQVITIVLFIKQHSTYAAVKNFSDFFC